MKRSAVRDEQVHEDKSAVHLTPDYHNMTESSEADKQVHEDGLGGLEIPPAFGAAESASRDSMSEAERREWDQLLAEHKQKETRGPEGDVDGAAASTSAFPPQASRKEEETGMRQGVDLIAASANAFSVPRLPPVRSNSAHDREQGMSDHLTIPPVDPEQEHIEIPPVEDEDDLDSWIAASMDEPGADKGEGPMRRSLVD